MAEKSICYLVTQGEFGGAQRYVFDLATNRDKQKYECLVLMGPEKLDLKERLEQKGVPAHIVKNLVRAIHPLKDIKAILELKEIFAKLEPDIIHLNSGKAGFLGSIAAWLAGSRNVVFTAHGFTFLEPNPWPFKLLYLLAEKIAGPLRKKIICVSKFDKQQALKYKVGAPEQLVTIHNGYDLDKIKIQKSKFKTANQNSKIVGTIANLYPTKGINYLIDAAHILYSKFHIPDSEFVVIGEGRERKNLESRIKKLGLEKNFFLLGAKPNAAQYLSGFDIFVLPSVKEGFPYTILEAMAAGLPIVATQVGGIPEAITHQKEGLLVPAQNPEALAEAILKLLGDPNLAQTLARNAENKVSEFSLSAMLARTQRVYEEVLQNQKR